MTPFSIFIYLVTGISAGVLAGLFGIGGGLVIVPILVLLMGYTQQAASGTSLVALLGPVGLMGVVAYYRSGRIDMGNIKAGVIIALGIFLGTYFGAQLGSSISSTSLKRAFCVFLILVAVKMWG